MWDDLAVRVGIHALGAVEASMDYGAINPTDPISIGLFQWFGTRAAALLQRIATENPSSWSSAPSTIVSDMAAHPATDSFWNTRYLTSGERTSLSSVLSGNHAIQDSQAAVDMETYRDVATRNGMNANTNTKSVLFFCNMYNQSPVAALRVLRAATVTTSLDNLKAKCLADSTLGAYSSRYNTAYTIINTMDPTGVGAVTPTAPSDPLGTAEPPDNPVSRVTVHGDLIVVYTNRGKVVCYPVTANNYVPRDGGATTSEPVPGDTTDPGAPPSDDYPYSTRPIGVASPFAFYYRECVDFCAWRIRSRDGRPTFTNSYKGVRWGNANNWNNAAAQAGIRVDSTPAVGAIAHRERGTFGHVAYVCAVNGDGTYNVEEYNFNVNHGYGFRANCDLNDFESFIHFEDTP